MRELIKSIVISALLLGTVAALTCLSVYFPREYGWMMLSTLVVAVVAAVHCLRDL